MNDEEKKHYKLVIFDNLHDKIEVEEDYYGTINGAQRMCTRKFGNDESIGMYKHLAVMYENDIVSFKQDSGHWIACWK